MTFIYRNKCLPFLKATILNSLSKMLVFSFVELYKTDMKLWKNYNFSPIIKKDHISAEKCLCYTLFYKSTQNGKF